MGITLKNNKQVTKNMTIKGDNGVGIKTITSGTPVVTEEKTTTPITVTLTDETTQNFNVEAQNGSGADNALTKPTTAPSATQIVAVDNTNSQKMLTIGDGLSIENDTLKASGGKLYQHYITIEAKERTFYIFITVYTTNSEIFTKEDFISYMYNKAFIASGIDPTNNAIVLGLFSNSIDELGISLAQFSLTDGALSSANTTYFYIAQNIDYFFDNVFEI